MGYVAVGVLGFLVACLFDVVSLKRIRRAKPAVGLVAAGLIGYATLMVCLRSERLVLPVGVTWLGWGVLLISLLLITYSLFINLPWRKTYMAPGVGDTLIRTGTYAMVRHPGVLWYALLLISLILVSKAKLLLIASPVWFFMDIVYVFIQDRFLFGKMFAGYEDYRQETPMLIPTKKSMDACFRTLRLARAQGEVQGRRG